MAESTSGATAAPPRHPIWDLYDAVCELHNWDAMPIGAALHKLIWVGVANRLPDLYETARDAIDPHVAQIVGASKADVTAGPYTETCATVALFKLAEDTIDAIKFAIVPATPRPPGSPDLPVLTEAEMEAAKRNRFRYHRDVAESDAAAVESAIRPDYPPTFPIDWDALRRGLERDGASIVTAASAATGVVSAAVTKPKKPTAKGDARAKIVAALTQHHRYADGGCLNREPIGNNELARQAKVAGSSVSDFFKREFGSTKGAKDGRANYERACRDGNLVAALKMLNDEFRPGILYGSKPPGEGDGANE